jgi:hypothetical protein
MFDLNKTAPIVVIVAATKVMFIVITTTAQRGYGPGNLQGVAENRGKG